VGTRDGFARPASPGSRNPPVFPYNPHRDAEGGMPYDYDTLGMILLGCISGQDGRAPRYTRVS
jgi:hypothetical protein